MACRLQVQIERFFKFSENGSVPRMASHSAITTNCISCSVKCCHRRILQSSRNSDFEYRYVLMPQNPRQGKESCFKWINHFRRSRMLQIERTQARILFDTELHRLARYEECFLATFDYGEFCRSTQAECIHPGVGIAVKDCSVVELLPTRVWHTFKWTDSITRDR